jgi:hypothetical protein
MLFDLSPFRDLTCCQLMSYLLSYLSSPVDLLVVNLWSDLLANLSSTRGLTCRELVQ